MWKIEQELGENTAWKQIVYVYLICDKHTKLLNPIKHEKSYVAW